MPRHLVPAILLSVAFAAELAAQPVRPETAGPGFVPPVPKGLLGDGKVRSSETPIPFPAEDEKWLRVTTPHFSMMSSASDKKTRELARDLETLATSLGELGPQQAARAPEAPTRILLFSRRREAQPYFDVLLNMRDADVSGVFVSQKDGGSMLIDASRGPANRTGYHELIHYLTAATGSRPPLWLEEGIAEYYSNATVRKNTISAGAPIVEHIERLRRHKLVPLDELFAVKAESEAAIAPILYAESWAAVDWLIRTRPQAFKSFVSDVRAGTPVDTALRQRFGRTVDDLWRGITLRGEVPRMPTVIRVAQHDESMTVSELSRADVLYELGHFLSGIEDVTPEAERHFRAALAADPRHARSLVALGDLRMRARKYEEAEPFFAAAVAVAPGDGAIWLSYAEALLQNDLGVFAQTDQTSANDLPRLRKARSTAEKALALGADRARALGAIGTSYLAESAFTPGIRALEEAHALSPVRTDYALHLFYFYRSLGDTARGAPLREELEKARTPQVRFALRSVMVRVDMARANELVRQQKLPEAAALMRRMAADTEDAGARADLEKQAADLDRVARTNREIELYNAAIHLTNAGKHQAALKSLDELLKTAQDAAVVRDAKKLRSQLLAVQ